MLTSSNIPQLCLYEVTTAVIISLQKSVMKKDMPLKSFYQAFLIQCEFLYKIYLLFLWMRQPENGTDSDGWREVKIAKEGVPWWFRRRAGQEVAVEYREGERGCKDRGWCHLCKATNQRAAMRGKGRRRDRAEMGVFYIPLQHQYKTETRKGTAE